VTGRSVDTQCEKCKVDMTNDLVVTGTVPLTAVLLQAVVDGKLESLNTVDVEPYLIKNLHWRVQLLDDAEYARDQVPGLKVSVCSTVVAVGDDDVPQFSGEYTMHPTVTDGRPGGHNVGDEV